MSQERLLSSNNEMSDLNTGPIGERLDSLKKVCNAKYDAFNFKPYANKVFDRHVVGDVPIHEVGKLFNPNYNCDFYEYKKPFLESSKLKRGDKDFEMQMISKDVKLPSYFEDPESLKAIFSKGPGSSQVEKFVKDTEASESQVIEFRQKYFHTIEKPRFFGPKTLTITEDWKIYYISPLNVVAEIDINCTGYAMVDTFHTILRYSYDSDLYLDGKELTFMYDTRVTAEVEIVIISQNMMTGTIKSQGLEDHTTATKERIIPTHIEVAKYFANQYYKGLKRPSRESQASNVAQPSGQATQVNQVRNEGSASSAFSSRRSDILSEIKEEAVHVFTNVYFIAFIVIFYLISRIFSENMYLFVALMVNIFGLMIIYKRVNDIVLRVEKLEKRS